MPKPVSLTAHRNTKARQRSKGIRNEIRLIADDLPRTFDGKPIAGYACVVWTADGESRSWWDTWGTLGPVSIDSHVSDILRRTLAVRDAKRLLDDDD